MRHLVQCFSLNAPCHLRVLDLRGSSQWVTKIMTRWTSLALFLVSATLATQPMMAQEVDFFPVDELREGMVGVGRTVFHGTTIEDFDVEILGVLKNSSPRQDMILARLSGGPLARTGVMQGMSGSPVYIEGRLLGAVAFGFASSLEPIAGIQPISQMINVLDQPDGEQRASMAAPLAMPAEGVRSYMNRVMTASGEGNFAESYLLPQSWTDSGAAASLEATGLQPIRTPLFLSGVSPVAAREFSGLFEAFGFTSAQGGGTGSATSIAGVAGGPILPGASISAELVRGDISVSANGTVTHVDDDKVYAFGHPFQSTGPTDLPMTRGYVISLLPNRVSSFKLAVPLDTVGSFQQDRSTGISGRLGETASMIPVSVDLQTSRNGVERYQYEVIDDRFMTPLMMNMTLFSLILATERSLGDLTLEVSGTIKLEGGQEVAIDNAFAGELNAPVQATLATVAPISYLLSGGFDALEIQSVELSVRSTDRRRSAHLDAVRVDRTEVRAGETVTLEASLRTLDGNAFVERYPVLIPEGLAPGRVLLVIGDGVTMTASDLQRAPSAAPHDLGQVIRELNDLRKTDRLYVKLFSSNPGAVIDGEELPSLPPSMMALLNTRRSSDSHTSGTQVSPVSEFELKASDMVIQGQRSLSLRVVP